MTDNQVHCLAIFCYSMLECYMGKNKLIANSIPELVWMIFKNLWSKS